MFNYHTQPIALVKGTQIALVPDHAYGNINHADVRFGFVASVEHRTGNVYCRFWSDVDPSDLRTKANSELCDARNVVPHVFCSQSLVKKMIEKYNI